MSEEQKTKFEPDGPNDKFQFTTLNKLGRQNLVELSKEAFIEVDKLELSALGANAELYGDWSTTKLKPKPELVSWLDIGSYGRTVHSVVVKRGYLFPLGHRATLTEIFQRVIAPEPTNGAHDSGSAPLAYLQVRKFIKVAQPVKAYGATGQPFAEASGGASDWPFSSVRMVTLVTPEIYTDKYIGSSQEEKKAFWPTYEPESSRVDFLWRFVATDLAGNDIAFEMPLVYVPGSGQEYKTGSGSWTEELVEMYKAVRESGSHQTWSRPGGAPLRFAPEVPGKTTKGNTTHPTLLLVLGAATSTSNENSSAEPSGPGEAALINAAQPNFYPTISSARVRLHAADALRGEDFSDEQGPPPGKRPAVGGVEFRYYPHYVALGTSHYGPGARKAAAAGSARPDGTAATENPGSVYAETVNNVALNLPSSSVGALGTPNATIAGLSAAIGAVGGGLKKGSGGVLESLENYAKEGGAKLKEYFKEAEEAGAAALSELLGGLKLVDILQGAVSEAAAVPGSWLARPDGDGEEGFQTPTISSLMDPSSGPPTVKYKLHTALKSWGPEEQYPVFVPDGSPGYLTLVTEVVKGLDGAPPTYNVEGSIDPFAICLFGENSETYFLRLHFESFTFTSVSGGKPSIHVNLNEVNFEGALEFVQTLEEFLESLGGEGLSVHVEPTDIKIGTSITLPPIEVGILSLSGLGFNGSVDIPFISGTAIATFGFASKENPFTLTVVMFGGGGFVALSVGFGGVQSVELQFEFEGHFGFDIVVASGSLSLVAGIYIKYEVEKHSVFLEGFVRVTGQLEVLGIISISAELVLSLIYETPPGRAEGTATLRAHFSVFGFGASVSITMHKEFAGGSKSSSSVRRATDKALAAASAAARPDAEFPEPKLKWEDLIDEEDWKTYVGAFNAPPRAIS